MVELLPSHPMEDFFINPTMMKMHHTRDPSATMDDTSLHLATTATKLHSKKPHASLTDLSVLSQAPALGDRYASDEEAASPIDFDSLSLHSNNSIDSSFSEISSPDLQADNDDHDHRHCNKAHVVTFQSVGKPKMVSVPKLVDAPARRRPATSGDAQQRRPPPLRLRSTGEASPSWTSQKSSRNSSVSSTFDSPASTAPSSVGDHTETPSEIRRAKTLSRHVPLMEAARAITPVTPSSTSEWPSTPDHGVKRASTVSSSATPTSLTSKKSLSRRKTKFGLNRLGKNPSRGAEDPEPVRDPEPNVVTPQPLQPADGTRRARKMVARGADEREPTITLPPFPDGGADGAAPSRRRSVATAV